jgi:tetratricopeptide (TPR) repeat protein
MKACVPLIATLLLSAMPLVTAEEGAPSTALDRGIRLFETGKYDAARGVLEEVASGADADGRASFYVGRACFEESRWKDAARWFEKAVQKAPGTADYHLWLGRAYSRWAQDSSWIRKLSLAGDIRASFDKAVELAPDNLEAREDLMTFYVVAPAVAGGDLEKARAQAEEIKSRDIVRGHLAHGRISESQEDFEKARADYEAGIRAAPEDERLYYRLGYLLQRVEDWEGALRTFTALAERKPDEMRAVYQIGRTGALSGRHLDEAAAALERYAQHEPGEDSPSLAWAHYRLGQVYLHMGRTDKAKAALETVLKLDPGHEEAKKALKALK